MTILLARGLTVSEAQRATMLGSTDTTTLDRWIFDVAAAAGVAVVPAGARMLSP